MDFSKETVADWNCHADCAVKMLDEQSGVLKSGKPGVRKKEWSGYDGGLKKLDKESGFGDTGGASRFFKQFSTKEQPETEAILGKYKIVKGDCIVALKAIPDISIDSLVCDPPAGISMMGKAWDSDKGGRDEWIAWMASIATEIHRVLKPGGHGLVWALPRTSHWTATAFENAGFEIRDVVNHIFGTGFPKSQDISKAMDKAAGVDREKSSFEQIDGDRMIAQTIHAVCTVCGKRAYSGNPCQCPDPSKDAVTPEAKKWQGFGTALKPAAEAWLLIAKPFTSVPLDAIISEINSNLREIICQQLHAPFVQKISMSNLLGLSEESDFAQWIVVVLNTQESADSYEKTDMFKSPEMEKTCLNIVVLWKSILDAFLRLENKSIIKMETDLITELKILNYSILPIMQNIITKDGMSLSGEKPNVTLVQNLLESASLRLQGFLEIFVQENASIKVGNLKSQHQKKQEHVAEIAKDILSENWILVRRPLGVDTVAKNVQTWGTGGLNIDESRIVKRDVVGKKTKPNTQGRFPSNVVFSHHPECELVGEKEVKSDDYRENPSTNKTTWFGAKDGSYIDGVRGYGKGGKETVPDWNCHKSCAVKELDGQSDTASGASRFFYCSKASKADRNNGLDKLPKGYGKRNFSSGMQYKQQANGDRTSIEQIPEANTHPTVKNTKLMEYLIKLVTPPNGVVLDPFMGSGSTGIASLKTGFNFYGIELEPEYFEIAKARLKALVK